MNHFSDGGFLLRIGIEASNIRAGGGITHLSEVLSATNPDRQGFDHIIVWAGKATIERLPLLPHIEYRHRDALDGNLVSRFWWQTRYLAGEARDSCDVLFIPGGTYLGTYRPFVAMAQNSLPFSREQMRHFVRSPRKLKFEMLRQTQILTFKRAAVTIYPSHFLRNQVKKISEKAAKRSAVIPHGLNRRFDYPPRPQRALEELTRREPFRLLYVSIVDAYKHQWKIVEAVAQLRAEGLMIDLDLVGPPVSPYVERLMRSIQHADPRGEFIRYHGEQPFTTLHETYRAADGFVFASTCESFGQIILEAMSAGLPIACSNRGAMPEVLGEGGVYFDPEDFADTVKTLREFVTDAELRARLAYRGYERASTYSWETCADETINTLVAAGS